MPDRTGAGGRAASVGSREPRRDVQELVAQGQRLVQAPRPTGDDALSWHVQAFYLGDFPAAAAAALRARTRP